ncbi:superoxide dismutase [Rappaport israeli]|uniref:superoxide dismutase n=1 Tax=Rappaport israeli TaxID=1839807 RepID=UPI000931C8CA|nr:superoxide dismutase [Rappaport israeli]
MKHQFQPLPYAYDALEPTIDAQTMTLHHDKHHQGYFDKFTAAIEGSALENQSMEEIFANIGQHSNAIRNNGGGFYNHNIFWQSMSPNGGGEPTGALAEAIERDFGSFETFKEAFTDAATSQFGSGWAWLILKKDGKLAVTHTPNQDNPLMSDADEQGAPLLALDVWEHAYYLNYQNKRPDYVKAWWNVVNWDFVAQQYQQTQ